MKALLAGLSAMMLCAAPVASQAQTYPQREITVVVGLPAGSGGDVVARYYADQLSRLAGVPAIVENRPGMILSLGAAAVAKAKPDGYTILVTSISSSHAANQFMFKSLPYDPVKDFIPVATLQQSYFLLMVRPQSWDTVADLTKAMKKKGKKASYGYGSPPALASAELYKAHTGIEAVRVPYKTSMASLPEMYRGDLDFQFIDGTQGTPLREAGKLRALAVTASKRIPGVDLPTMAESIGLPEFDITPTWGVFLPVGVPEPIVAQLETWFLQITKLDATRKFLANTHAASFPGDRTAAARFLKAEVEKWRKLSEIAQFEKQ